MQGVYKAAHFRDITYTIPQWHLTGGANFANTRKDKNHKNKSAVKLLLM